MNVLSLFDGISGARVALDKLGIKVDNYYASEIDKYAIQVSKKNYPNIIQLGDVTKVDGTSLPHIDLLIGGSPCQGFSIAGHQLNFEDPRSKLFFEYVRILKEVKPTYFILENVKMKKEYQDIISEYLGVQPIEINSGLLSAQNRPRLYWTNIPNVELPKDKGLTLRDIYFSGDYRKNYDMHCLRDKKVSSNGLIQIGKANIKGHDSIRRVYHLDGKAPTLTTMGGGHREPKVAVSPLYWAKLLPMECEQLQTYPIGYTEGLSNSQRYKCLGNSFTVDVIAHILSYIKEEK